MKQKKLITEAYKACIVGDDGKIFSLRIKEFKKILKRKDKNKPFTVRWTSLKL